MALQAVFSNFTYVFFQNWPFWPWFKRAFQKPVFKIPVFWTVQKLFYIHFLEFCQIKKSVKKMLLWFNTVMNSFIKYAATQERFSLAHLSQHISILHLIGGPMRNRKKKHRVQRWDISGVLMILSIVNLQIWIFQLLQIHCISKHMDGCWNWLHLNFTLQHKQSNDQTS